MARRSRWQHRNGATEDEAAIGCGNEKRAIVPRTSRAQENAATRQAYDPM
jgi:hypothetical protein